MSTKRIAIAQISQETNTFSPVLCGLKDFLKYGIYFKKEIIEKMRNKDQLGGFLAVAEAENMDLEILPIIYARSTSSGRVKTEVLDFFKERLESGLKEVLPLDAVFLSLHGAAAAEQEDDLEGCILEITRKVIGKDIPIVLTLDHHANITKRIIENTDILVGHETQPHKLYETGEKGAKILFSLLKGEFTPAVGWQKIPMVAPQDNFHTDHGPMQEWFDLAREMEKDPRVIKISNFPMQPWLDVSEAGWTTVVYTNNNYPLARKLAVKLANKAWELREKFWFYKRVSPADLIKQISNAKEGPIIVSDIADTVLGGAPGDSTCLLKEMLKQKIEFTALLPMFDPEVTEEAIKAGKGSRITVMIGGKRDNVYNEPVKVTGEVFAVSEGFTIEINERPYRKINREKTVILKVGNIMILVGKDRGIGGVHPEVYRYFGIEPAEAKMIVVKTGSNFQYYDSIQKGLILADCPGLGQSDLKKFNWKRAPHPLYPIDDLQEWHAR